MKGKKSMKRKASSSSASTAQTPKKKKRTPGATPKTGLDKVRDMNKWLMDLNDEEDFVV